MASGAVADWLFVHVHLLADFHTHSQVAGAITQLIVFVLTAGLSWLGQQKWLTGWQVFEQRQEGNMAVEDPKTPDPVPAGEPPEPEPTVPPVEPGSTEPAGVPEGAGGRSVGAMHISDSGLRLIEGFEGYSSTRYLDSVGVPTIGYDTTAAVVGTVPATTTREQAEKWLRDSVAQKYEPAVNALGVPMTQNQFDALVSLAYNCGPGAMGWNIGVHMRQRNYAQASADFMRYVNAGGRPLQGLVNRRAAERKLFDTPDSKTQPTSTPVATPKPKPPEGEIAVASGDRVEAFVLKADGSVGHRWKTDGGAWSRWASLGKP